MLLLLKKIVKFPVLITSLLKIDEKIVLKYSFRVLSYLYLTLKPIEYKMLYIIFIVDASPSLLIQLQLLQVKLSFISLLRKFYFDFNSLSLQHIILD